MKPLLCEKCGKEIVPKDNVVNLGVIALNNSIPIIAFPDRHIRCSPGVAQFIIHPDFAPVEKRPDYGDRIPTEDERMALEKMWTAAWVELQAR